MLKGKGEITPQLLTIIQKHFLSAADVKDVVSNAAIGVDDDDWINQGEEINCIGSRIIGIWVDMEVNDSEGNQLQVLCKYKSDGVQEYVLMIQADYQQTLGDKDIKIMYPFDVLEVPYIQIQTKATDVIKSEGTSTGIITINITKIH